MSIIHDALKKVQQSLEKEPETLIQREPPADPPAQIMPASDNTATDAQPAPTVAPKASPVLLTACAIVFMAFSWMTVVTTKAKHNATQDKIIKPNGTKPLAQVTVKSTPPQAGPQAAGAPQAPDSLTLNVQGVMANGTNNIALINGQVYQEGSEVQGIKIVKINLDSLVVINNGKEETIQVRK